MDCTTARKSITALQAGDLPGEDLRLMLRHLASCGACRSILDDRMLPELLPALDEIIEPSADLGARFHDRLIRHQTRLSGSSARARHCLQSLGHWIMGRRVPAAALAASVIVCAVIAGIYLRRGGEGEILTSEEAVVENLPLLQDLEVISNLELLEDFEEIKELRPESSSAH